jgi:hypothetical protein
MKIKYWLGNPLVLDCYLSRENPFGLPKA